MNAENQNGLPELQGVVFFAGPIRAKQFRLLQNGLYRLGLEVGRVRLMVWAA